MKRRGDKIVQGMDKAVNILLILIVGFFLGRFYQAFIMLDEIDYPSEEYTP